MPSEADLPLQARCYCGSVCLSVSSPALTVAYCHCRDCKRWTGAPAPAFAAVTEGDVTWSGTAPSKRSFVPGVTRWTCPDCGSPLAARFSYLPGQMYLPLGIIDQIDALAPQLHCHHEARVPWLHDAVHLPVEPGSARDNLNSATQAPKS